MLNSRVTVGFLLLGEMFRVELIRVTPVLGQEVEVVGVEGERLPLPQEQPGVGQLVVLLHGPQVDADRGVEPQGLEDDHVEVGETLDDVVVRELPAGLLEGLVDLLLQFLLDVLVLAQLVGEVGQGAAGGVVAGHQEDQGRGDDVEFLQLVFALPLVVQLHVRVVLVQLLRLSPFHHGLVLLDGVQHEVDQVVLPLLRLSPHLDSLHDDIFEELGFLGFVGVDLKETEKLRDT